VLARTNAQLPPLAKALAAAAIAVRHNVHGAGSPIQPILAHVYRLGAGSHLRSWAQDVLEGDEPNEREVAQGVLDFLRAQPMGDGPGFRAWVEATDPFGKSTPGVELLTFHGAKGREWHTVHLVGCETSLVPHRSATTLAARAEEARLLYVAITRATDELVVNWARRRGGYQRRPTPLLDGFVSTTPEPAPPPAELIRDRRRSERDLILERLSEWRADVARAAQILPQAVCSDATLAAIADQPPADAAALDALTGLGAITSNRLFSGIAAAVDAALVRS
jgi:DNA helicase-2/ATP-dependent DNA helicase PcrA